MRKIKRQLSSDGAACIILLEDSVDNNFPSDGQLKIEVWKHVFLLPPFAFIVALKNEEAIRLKEWSEAHNIFKSN